MRVHPGESSVTGEVDYMINSFFLGVYNYMCSHNLLQHFLLKLCDFPFSLVYYSGGCVQIDAKPINHGYRSTALFAHKPMTLEVCETSSHLAMEVKNR